MQSEKPTLQVNDEELTELQIDNVSLGPWSHSKIKVLEKCPFQFYLKYILKVKPVNAAPETLVTHVGSAAHLILEKVALGKSLTEAYSNARREFLDKITPEEWVEHVESLEGSIIAFSERLSNFNSINPIDRVYTELKIGLTRQYEPTGFFAKDVWFRGIIDLCVQLKSNDALMIDHKTGAAPEAGLRNYKDQLDRYKILYRFGVRPILGAQSGIHYIRAGEVKLDDYVSVDEIKNRLVGTLELSIEGAIDRIKELGYFKHIAHSGCKYCDYAVECKGGELKTVEKKTVRFFK